MIIPSTPAAGTGVGSLVYPAFYSQVTQGGDTDQQTLDDATVMIEQKLDRTLGYGQYTETLYVDRIGMVFPTATPLDPNYPLTPDSGLIQGAGIFIGYYVPLPDMPVWSGILVPQTQVSYAGGYQPYGVTDGPTPGLPPALARCVCQVAWFINNPALLPGRPGGATSTSVGGVSIAGDLSSMITSDPALRRELSRWRRQTTKAW